MTIRLVKNARPTLNEAHLAIFIASLPLVQAPALAATVERSFHITMDVLADQLFEIQAGLRVANRIAGLERVAAAAGRKSQKFFTDDASRFNRRNRVRIELDPVVYRQNHR